MFKHHIKQILLVLLLTHVPIFSNTLLQKPKTLSAQEIEELAHKWETCFTWNFGYGCAFRCLYEKEQASFIFQLFGLPVRSYNFQYVAALKKLAHSFREPTYYFEKPLIVDNTHPQPLTLNELSKLMKEKKFIFYTGAGISAGAVATMSGLHKAIKMDKSKTDFFKEFLLHPSTITNAFSHFCHTAIHSKPTPAHCALHELAQKNECAIVTENVDLLQHRTGSLPVFTHSDVLYSVSTANLQKVDFVICIGLSHDDCGFLAKYKKANPHGRLIAIDIKKPNYVGSEDFFIQADAQQLLPALADLSKNKGDTMLTNEQQLAAQQLISAAEHDKKVYTQLEQSGELFSDKNPDNYHPTMRKVHEENGQLLEEFIARYGWPVPSVWEQEVHEAAWFIAIHAISKPHLLKKSCVFIKQALDNGEQVAEQYARLFDRIALYEGRQQRYGTQFFPRADGTWYARDLEDPARVEERRAEIGLVSFVENQKEVDAWAATLPEPAKPVDEEQFIQFLKEVGWR